MAKHPWVRFVVATPLNYSPKPGKMWLLPGGFLNLERNAGSGERIVRMLRPKKTDDDRGSSWFDLAHGSPHTGN